MRRPCPSDPATRSGDESALCDSLQILLTKSQHIASLFPPRKRLKCA